MKPCIKANEIPRELKEMLPTIPYALSEERFCTYCPYYAGNIGHARRCMLRICAWDNEKIYFHPAFRILLKKTRKECRALEEKYLEKKEKVEILESMFAEELVEEQRKKDKCYGCPYSREKPCIGICYVDLLEGRGEKEDE